MFSKVAGPVRVDCDEKCQLEESERPRVKGGQPGLRAMMAEKEGRKGFWRVPVTSYCWSYLPALISIFGVLAPITLHHLSHMGEASLILHDACLD